MKKLSLLLIVLLFSLASFGRVRTVPPSESYTVLQVRCIDSVEYLQILVEFQGKIRVVVVGSDCFCVLTRASAIYLFGFSSYQYVKPRELDTVYSILRK